MRRFASDTSVSVERSKAEIESLVMRYGATGFASGWSGDQAQIQFMSHDRMIRFNLPLPRRDEKRFTTTPAGRKRLDADDQYKAWEQGCRQLWRALTLAIKAKLEAVECGISSFDSEFLAQIVDPFTGKTVGEIMRPQIAESYKNGPRQLLLCGPQPV